MCGPALPPPLRAGCPLGAGRAADTRDRRAPRTPRAQRPLPKLPKRISDATRPCRAPRNCIRDQVVRRCPEPNATHAPAANPYAPLTEAKPPEPTTTHRTNHHSPISQQTCQRHTSRHRPLAADSVSDELPAASQGHSTHCKSRAAHPPRT